MTRDGDEPIRPRQEGNFIRPREEEELIRRRQRSRALVLAMLLGAFVILIFAISIAKIQMGMHK